MEEKTLKIKVVGNAVVNQFGPIATFDSEGEASAYSDMVESVEEQRSANREFKKAKGW